MRICLENKIILCYLPPYCSHVLQPLDLAVFAPLKTAYRKSLSMRSKYDLTKAQFIEIYPKKIRLQCIIKGNIEAGFEKSRIYPLNRSRPLSNHYVRKIYIIWKPSIWATKWYDFRPNRSTAYCTIIRERLEGGDVKSEATDQRKERRDRHAESITKCS